jgi:hypothetical protein
MTGLYCIECAAPATLTIERPDAETLIQRGNCPTCGREQKVVWKREGGRIHCVLRPATKRDWREWRKGVIG